ncbi:FeoA family protein [Helicobacter marmotae]|uniref:Ferrous iron transport protein A n=1 Tax=Helicobacter marmotae TaxID=152490 RepID=A0A3D8I537_9HELI|nr:FeoA family protein [Helicobacter marmotae]RDU60116.1 ferrous iron transport protein A [Helicobacter marmotae]
MTLHECALGARCRIVRCEAQDEALRDRFISFGIVKDRVCEVVSHSIKHLAVAILINGTQVALRDNEAKMIIVEPLLDE